MTAAEIAYHEIADAMTDVLKSSMFGALCIKAPNGKAGVMLHRDNMVFKLPAAKLAATLQLKGAGMFDPMGGRPMNGWVQLPLEYAHLWPGLAAESMAFVREIDTPKKPGKQKKAQ